MTRKRPNDLCQNGKWKLNGLKLIDMFPTNNSQIIIMTIDMINPISIPFMFSSY